MTHQPNQTPCLISGKGASEIKFPLVDRAVWTVGRSSRSDIFLDYELISRKHVPDVFSRHTLQLKGFEESSVVYATRYPKIDLILESLRRNLEAG